MSSIQVIVGSMLGGSEYVAEAIAQTLQTAGHQVQLHFKPNFEQVRVGDQIWLICTSTHGTGELPDNLKDFAETIETTDVDLSCVKYGVIGLGDSGYDSYCQAATIMEQLLESKHCQKLIDKLLIDARDLNFDPEDKADFWIQNNLSAF